MGVEIFTSNLMKTLISSIAIKFKDSLVPVLISPITYAKLFRFLLFEYNSINLLVFLVSASLTFGLLILDYTKTGIVFYCTVWFLNIQLTNLNKSKLIDEIINDDKKRKFYEKEIFKILQSRHLLNDHINNFEWINFLIKTKWSSYIRKVL